jgi:hypothetical protein
MTLLPPQSWSRSAQSEYITLLKLAFYFAFPNAQDRAVAANDICTELGQLFKARRLTPAQEARLAKLDRLLLEQASLMEQCYGLDLSHLLAIFRWGTPLPRFAQTVQIEVQPASLDRMAASLAPSLPH